jgi:HEAT repeat protein
MGNPGWRCCEAGEARGAAPFALGQLGAADVEARAALFEALGDRDYRVRSGAALALRQSAAADPEARAALLRTLADPDSRVRGIAARALGQSAVADPDLNAWSLARMVRRGRACPIARVSLQAGRNMAPEPPRLPAEQCRRRRPTSLQLSNDIHRRKGAGGSLLG